jgi:glycosyltransferase involved in cell wall biosynthesis
LFKARHFDLLWIEKELFPGLPAWAERLLASSGVRYVIDYDDAVFHNYDRHRNPIVRKLLGKKIDSVMRDAAVVVCGNSYLAERASKAGARRIEIVPTVIDLQRYSMIEPAVPQESIRVGWMGSLSTVKYLRDVAPALRAASTNTPLKLIVVGARCELPKIDVEFRSWSEDSEVEEIQHFDIGIMPLHRGPWELGKCGYKLIQYMACGKPVIASPIGVNQEIVQHGLNGYLATDVGSWRRTLEELSANAEARRTMGERGRIDVEKKYCLQKIAPRIAQIFRSAAG